MYKGMRKMLVVFLTIRASSYTSLNRFFFRKNNYTGDETWNTWTGKLQMHVLFQKFQGTGEIPRKMPSPLYFFLNRRGEGGGNKRQVDKWVCGMSDAGAGEGINHGGMSPAMQQGHFEFPGFDNSPDVDFKKRGLQLWPKEKDITVGIYRTAKPFFLDVWCL
jgi:hypothetical protein